MFTLGIVEGCFIIFPAMESNLIINYISYFMQISAFTFLWVIFGKLLIPRLSCISKSLRDLFIIVRSPGHFLGDSYMASLACIPRILNLKIFLSDFERRLGVGTYKFLTKFHSYLNFRIKTFKI